MAIQIDMPTNEGTLALARAVSTGAKLIIRGIRICMTEGAFGSVTDVAGATWGIPPEGSTSKDLSAYAVEDAPLIRCTCYLPSLVQMDGSVDGAPLSALDIEFTWMPDGQYEYDTVAVLADLYYEFVSFQKGRSYNIGATVYVTFNDNSICYYRCKESVEDSDLPQNDSIHWEIVLPNEELEASVTSAGEPIYKSITNRHTLLYVTIASNSIVVSPEMEIDYKVRLYIDGVDNTERVKQIVLFDTLGPEFMGSAQLDLLATFATQLRYIRDVANKVRD